LITDRNLLFVPTNPHCDYFYMDLPQYLLISGNPNTIYMTGLVLILKVIWMKWVTREKAKVERIAYPWLIKKFIDPEAEFLFVPREKVLEIAKKENAIPFDTPSAELSHGDGGCTFEVILEKYNIRDPALLYMAKITHGPTSKKISILLQNQRG